MSYENLSGHGDFAEVPDEIRKWNWGAFWLTWIWGIGNNSYIALLALLPIANIIMPFYLGAHGNELTWRNRYWADTEELNTSQKRWAVAGWTFVGIIVLLIAVQTISQYKADKINSSITNQVLDIVSKNEEAKKLIGDEYIVAFKPALQTVTMTGGTFPVGHTIILRGTNGIINVYTSFDKEHNIEKITVSPPNNNNKDNNKDKDIVIDIKRN